MITSETQITGLPLGHKFVTKETFIKTRHTLNKIVWVKSTIVATEVMFLGYTNVYDGEIDKGGYDSETGYFDLPGFNQTKTHRVMVVQPVDNLKYRKPFYILSQRQKKGYFPTAESSAKQKETELIEQSKFEDLKEVLGIK